MKNITAKILTVLIGMVVADGAWAAIASKDYVDGVADTKQNVLTQAANAGTNITIDVDGKISATVPDVSGFATTNALTTGLEGKADKSTTYTKTEVNTALDDKANKLDTSVNIEVATIGTDGQYTRSGMTLADLQAATGDVTNKADKVTSATAGNLAGLDATGNITDSGVKAADVATTAELTTGLAGKADKLTTYTKDEVNTELGKKADTSVTDALATRVTATEGVANTAATNIGTITDLDTTATNLVGAINEVRANTAAIDLSPYAKTSDVDSSLLLKADKSDTYTKAEVNTELGKKTDTSVTDALTTRVTATEGVANAAKSTADTAATNIGTITDLDTTATNLVGAINEVRANTAAIDLTPYAKTEVVTESLNLKADKADTYTKTEVNTAVGAKQDKLTGTEGSVVTYGATPGAVGSVALGMLATAPVECSKPENSCVLTTNGSALAWEVIER